MAQELSSNWKKLQAKIKAESSSASTAAAPSSSSAKRKAAEPAEAAPARGGGEKKKKRKLREPSRKPTTPPVAQPAAGKKASAPGPSKAPPPPPMGVTQSSAVARGSAATVTPSLALWAEDNDISPEQLAEAYGLGLRRNGLVAQAEAERANEGRAPGVDVGKYVALDCEMVGVGPDGRDSVLARASLVDFHGRQVYDAYVRPRERVTDWRTPITGLGPRHLAAARDFDAVRAEVADLLRGRVLVGHDLKHDLAVLALTHPATHVRDTVRFAGFRQYGHGPKPALRVLARELLDMDIQSGHHSSIEDARVAMLLFRKRKSEFDMEHANKYEKAATASKARSQQPKKKKKH